MSEKLHKIFGRYSVLDAAISLFTSSLWLPNIASPIKHIYLTAVFVSMNPKFFSKKDQIKCYGDFKEFCETLYKAVPNFPIMEDCVPEIDWGDVKFHHREKNYRIFYGCEIENIYDYLELFRILHEGHDENYIDITGRSPMDELELCLELQDHIIASIKTQPDPNSVDILPGHIEVPSEEFWKETSEFYSNFKLKEFTKKFADQMSADWGTVPEELLQKGKFEGAVFTGKLLPHMFLRAKNQFYPILPRRFSYILFNQWGSIIRKFYDKLDKQSSYVVKISEELYKFVLERFDEKDYFPFVCALTTDNKPHEVIFPFGFKSRDRIILVYITPPTISPHMVSDHLTRVTPKIKEALSLISSKPNKLMLILKNQVVESRTTIKPELLVVTPLVSTETILFDVPPELPGKKTSMDQFLAMADELNSGNELASFFDFLDRIEVVAGNPLASLADKYAAYKDSLGTLIEGAIEPDLIMLDPHGGSDYRFRSLKNFWEKYPDTYFSIHPRNWKITRETDSRIGLESKSSFGKMICSQVLNTIVSMTAPFPDMTHDQSLIASILMHCADYYLHLYKDVKEHRFFSTHDRLHVIFFPSSFIKRKEFNQLQHLNPGKNLWKADIIKLKPRLFGIRLVFNAEGATKDFEEITSNQIELDLLKEILFQLNTVTPDPNFSEIETALDEFAGQGAKCVRILRREKLAAFPEFVRPCKPGLADSRTARKRIAEIAKETGFTKGNYAHGEAKDKLNTLKTALVNEINMEVKALDYTKALPLSIARIDALTNEIEVQRFMAKGSGELEVDYDRAEILNVQENDYIRHYRSYQYLIEKLVQIQPEGKEELGSEKCKYLLELIRGLRAFQDSSDYLHYGVVEMRMSVRHDLVIGLHQEGEMKEKARKFGEERIQIRLGQKGNSDDGILVPEVSLERFLDDLNSAFFEDFGFKFENMFKILRLFTNWPKYQNNTEEATSYSATIEEITETSLHGFQDLTRDEIRLIINFLMLRSEDILLVLDQHEECSDIPVWEINKRPARYTLRPLVLIGDYYHWGAHSAEKSTITWSAGVGSGKLPVDVEGKATRKVLEKIRLLFGNALADKTHEVVSRYTQYTRKNVKLHKIDLRAGHPKELGDYDNLVFFPERNAVLNIECKSIPQVRCIKDARRLRDRIFGSPDKKDGYFSQISARQEYLQKNLKSIGEALGWPLDSEYPPRIIAVFLTQDSDWWTKYPPRDVNAEFVQIKLLEDFIDGL